MRSVQLPIASSTALFTGTAMVLVGSAMKLAHIGWGGIPLWNAANAIQSIGLMIVSGILLWSVKTLMSDAKTESEPVERYITPQRPTMRFADLPKPDRDPDQGEERYSYRSPLGDALQKIADKEEQGDSQAMRFESRPTEVAHMSRRPQQQGDGTKSDEMPGEELPLPSDRAAHDRGALQTASEHCFAGSDRIEHSFTERAARERDETRFQAAEDETRAWKREGAY